MAQDLQAAIAAIKQAIDADVAQDEKVTEAINILIAKIEGSGDKEYEHEVAALSDISAKLLEANTNLKTAVERAMPPHE